MIVYIYKNVFLGLEYIKIRFFHMYDIHVYVTSDDEEEGTGGLRNILSTNDL